MTRDNCFRCGKDVHISESIQFKIGTLDHQLIWICINCIDKELEGGSDYRVVKLREVSKED